MPPSMPKRTNILCLDGGGVRGYSSLLILKRLLCLLRVSLDRRYHGLAPLPAAEAATAANEVNPMLPGEVFDIVAGTSTGGLIALMIVKMGMSIGDCIQAYEHLASHIFTKRHLLGTFTRGLGRSTKYCGKAFRECLVEKVIVPNLPRGIVRPQDFRMTENSSHRDFHCTVVCNELYPETLDRKPNHAVHLCTHTCDQSFTRITVADAARATSAAPSFFSPVTVRGRILVDGGYGLTNNPSHTICTHWEHIWARDDGMGHFVNIGTGTDPPHARRSRSFIERWSGQLVQGLSRTKRDLVGIATDSETPAEHMKVIEHFNPQKVRFNRFSADTPGLRNIKLDAYKKLGEIQTLTNTYLQRPDVLRKLQEDSEILAETIMQRRQPVTDAAQTIIRTASIAL